MDKLEIGVVDQLFSLSFGGSSSRSSSLYKEENNNLRISYRMPSGDPGAPDSGYFHQFRATDLLFFNNVAVAASGREERLETLRGVAEAVAVAAEAEAAARREVESGLWVEDVRATEEVVEGDAGPALVVREGKLERKKSKIVEQHASMLGERWARMKVTYCNGTCTKNTTNC